MKTHEYICGSVCYVTDTEYIFPSGWEKVGNRQEEQRTRKELGKERDPARY
jgi:hypothetical protein